MSVPFWVLGLAAAALVLMGAAADFGTLERDYEAAAFLGERELERIAGDWQEIESYSRLQAWMSDARGRHRAARLVKWCMTVPPAGSGSPALRMDFEVDGAAERLLLRGASSNARARVVTQVLAPEHWPGNWRRTVQGAPAGPLGGVC